MGALLHPLLNPMVGSTSSYAPEQSRQPHLFDTLGSMFTGIVECMGRVERITTTTTGARLLIDPGNWPYHPEHGASICVSGVCLTHAPSEDGSESANQLAFDVIRETLDRTTLGEWSAGRMVNLEPPLTPSSPMGGHFVQGHVDGVGTITGVGDEEDWRVIIQPPCALMDAIVPKGSIAVDGVSLTVAAVADDRFEVALIRSTLNRTTLGAAESGMRANLETDIVSKTIVHWLARNAAEQRPVTRQTLREAGLF
jgi:riboflavin synthase